MRKILLIIILFSFNTNAQQIKSWQNYTSMQKINDFEFNENIFWAVTDGGVFSFSQLDSTYFLLTKSEGLSSQTLTSIAISNDNKIWIGTSEGYIDVYDPSTNQVSTIYEIFKENKSNKRINDIQISGDTVFVSTEFGLSLINSKDLSFFDSILKFGAFTSETPVLNVFLSDKIYVVTQAGIAINKDGFSNLTAPEAWENISLNSNIPVSEINRVTKLNGQLLAATNNGIYRQTNSTWSVAYLSGSKILNLYVEGQNLYSIVGYFDNDLERYTASSLYLHSNQNQEILKYNSGVLSKIDVLPSNEIAVGSYTGLAIIGEGNNNFIYPNAPGTNSTINLTVDSEGNLWSGTGKNNQGIGVLKFDRQSWENISTSNNSSFKFNDFHKVSSSNNDVYFLSWGKGFIKYKNNEYEIFDSETTELIGIPNSNNFIVINDAETDDEGNTWFLNYWAADRKPIGVIKTDGEIISYTIPTSISSQVISVENLTIDQYGTKWITGDFNGDAATEGIFYFNDNGTLENTSDDIWGKLSSVNGLRNNDVKDVVVDQYGELIIATSIGVDVIPNPSDPKSIRGDQYFAMRQQTVNCLAVDPINQKWFGTEKGIFLMNSDGSNLIANFTKSNSPLPTDVIKSIAIDKQNGIVYAGTDFGITAISTYFVEPNKDFSKLFIYPNPVLLSSNSNPFLIVDGLVEDSEIKIFDISGNLVNEFLSIGGKTTYWNCKDLNGKYLSSGIYIVVAYDSEVNEVGHAKFAVLRK
ncbi:MAG: T9SS type A sorting domain-containing protein [Ignavibacteriales bacterium]|nr:T9SS type A sorting domain-containing protein [Ignavibacteriales bacterium]